VVKRHALIGQWLGEGNPVVTLAVLDPIRVMVPVPEGNVTSVKMGDSAEVSFDALPGKVFRGFIKAIIPRGDEAARTFPVRVEIENPDTEIKAGMLGRVTLPTGVTHRALLVPKDALVLSGSGKMVYVVDRGKARPVPVELGPAHGFLVEILGDLKPGEQVVVRGNERLRPGQPLKILSGNKSKKPGAPAGPASHETR
jgi:RND family efflux transporter MFP subunit